MDFYSEMMKGVMINDIQDGRERTQLWYHDLQTLILMKSHSGYNLPDRVAH